MHQGVDADRRQTRTVFNTYSQCGQRMVRSAAPNGHKTAHANFTTQAKKTHKSQKEPNKTIPLIKTRAISPQQQNSDGSEDLHQRTHCKAWPNATRPVSLMWVSPKFNTFNDELTLRKGIHTNVNASKNTNDKQKNNMPSIFKTQTSTSTTTRDKVLCSLGHQYRCLSNQA